MVSLDFAQPDDPPADDAFSVVDLPMPPGFGYREYQEECDAKIQKGWETYTRQLVVMATGTGKTVVFCRVTKRFVDAGKKVLIIAHTDELLVQAAEKLAKSTGIQAEREKGDEFASLTASAVVASIQTISKDGRLTAFPDDHFDLVIVDETHRILAKTYLKVVNYFHYGEASLDEGWEVPELGTVYRPKAKILGFTATADRGDRRSLGEVFESVAYEYGMLEACRDGYLVRPVVKNLPLKIDLRGVKISRSSAGADYDASQVSERLTPLLKEIARLFAQEAASRKTIVFLPSVDAARRLAEACVEVGMDASFVSGACPDRPEKVEWFRRAGPGTLLCNAMLMTEGVDIPDISCVCVLRPTKIRALFVQAAGRGARPLSGVIDGLDTKELRHAAIASSMKPNMLILDFLWLSDRLDLVKPVDLVCTKPDVRERMNTPEGEVTDLLDLEGVATRDLLKSLEAAARKHADKKARVIDPIAWAVMLGDTALATWEPETKFDERPPTQKQLDFLTAQHIDASQIKYFGLAQKIIVRHLDRLRMKLATVEQLNFMHKLGIPDEKAAVLTLKEATATIEARLNDLKKRRQGG